MILYLALLGAAFGLGIAGLGSAIDFNLGQIAYWRRLDGQTIAAMALGFAAFGVTIVYSVWRWKRNLSLKMPKVVRVAAGVAFTLFSFFALALAAWEIASGPHYLRALVTVMSFCAKTIAGYFVFTSAAGRLEQLKDRRGIPTPR